MQFAINHPDGIYQDSSSSVGTIGDEDYLRDTELHNRRAKPVRFRS